MIFIRVYAPLAQLVEQLTLNQWVEGSNPSGRTKSNDLVLRRRGLGMTASDDSIFA